MQHTSRHTALRELVAALARAQRMLDAGHLDAARAALNHALDIDPGNVQALDLLGRIEARPDAAGRAGAAPAPAPSRPGGPAEGATSAAPSGGGAGWAAFEARVRARRAAVEARSTNAEALRGWPPADADTPSTSAVSPTAEVSSDRPASAAVEPASARQASPESVAVVVPPPPAALDTPTPLTPARVVPPRVSASHTRARHAAVSPARQLEQRPTEAPRARRRLPAVAIMSAAVVLLAGGVGVWLTSDGDPGRAVPEQEAVTDTSAGDRTLPPIVAVAPEATSGEGVTGPTVLSDDRPAGDLPASGPDETARSDAAAASEAAPPLEREAPARSSLPAVDPPVLAERDTPGEAPGARSSQARAPEPSPSATLPEPAAPLGTVARTASLDRGGAPTGALDPAPSVPAPASAPPPAAESAPPPLTMATGTPPAAIASAPPLPPSSAAASGANVAADAVEGVRRALDEYARAYSARDALAARQVWPAVDARALARAFEQLSEQEVTFTRCEIRPDGGDRAQAACTGRATWVPKVGDRTPRAEARTWRFALTRDGNEWVIDQVRF